MGLSSISFQEIDAYMTRCDVYLSGDEVLILRRMSQAYVNKVSDKNHNSKPPYGVAKPIKNNSFVEALKAIARVAK